MTDYPFKLTVQIDGVWRTIEGVLPGDEGDGPAPFETRTPPARSGVRPPERTGAPARPATPPARPAGGGDSWKDNAPQCEHGTMRGWEGEYKSGRNAGQSYRAYFCAAPKDFGGTKCKAIDADTGKVWS